ncbi:hypothetical protein SNEBB_002289 [Seison nebaliae]|nr:hypothetical protein SNEBB_002289 [Seison nebaliae]
MQERSEAMNEDIDDEDNKTIKYNGVKYKFHLAISLTFIILILTNAFVIMLTALLALLNKDVDEIRKNFMEYLKLHYLFFSYPIIFILLFGILTILLCIFLFYAILHLTTTLTLTSIVFILIVSILQIHMIEFVNVNHKRIIIRYNSMIKLQKSDFFQKKNIQPNFISYFTSKYNCCIHNPKIAVLYNKHYDCEIIKKKLVLSGCYEIFNNLVGIGKDLIKYDFIVSISISILFVSYITVIYWYYRKVQKKYFNERIRKKKKLKKAKIISTNNSSKSPKSSKTEEIEELIYNKKPNHIDELR